MKLHMDKINRAKNVLRIVKKGIEKLKAPYGCHASVDMYEGFREQGYCIKLYFPESKGHYICFSFAENRNSDHIVLYEFIADADNVGNRPTSEAYQDRYLSKVPKRAFDFKIGDLHDYMDRDVAFQIIKRIAFHIEEHIKEVASIVEPVLKSQN